MSQILTVASFTCKQQKGVSEFFISKYFFFKSDFCTITPRNFSLKLNMANRRHVFLALWPRKRRNALNKRKTNAGFSLLSHYIYYHIHEFLQLVIWIFRRLCIITTIISWVRRDWSLMTRFKSCCYTSQLKYVFWLEESVSRVMGQIFMTP